MIVGVSVRENHCVARNTENDKNQMDRITDLLCYQGLKLGKEAVDPLLFFAPSLPRFFLYQDNYHSEE